MHLARAGCVCTSEVAGLALVRRGAEATLASSDNGLRWTCHLEAHRASLAGVDARRCVAAASYEAAAIVPVRKLGV